MLEPPEARALLDSIDATTAVGLRDRALIGLMVYSFARVSAALGMKVGDVYNERRRQWVRLREKGGKRHEMPCHHNLEKAASMANHASTRTTQLYDRRADEVTLDEVERVGI